MESAERGEPERGAPCLKQQGRRQDCEAGAIAGNLRSEGLIGGTELAGELTETLPGDALQDPPDRAQ